MKNIILTFICLQFSLSAFSMSATCELYMINTRLGKITDIKTFNLTLVKNDNIYSSGRMEYRNAQYGTFEFAFGAELYHDSESIMYSSLFWTRNDGYQLPSEADIKFNFPLYAEIRTNDAQHDREFPVLRCALAPKLRYISYGR
jgi:hypothetical protein